MPVFLENFKSFIKQNKLFSADEKVLLAVSGGVDSIVLAQLLSDAGFNFGIAHCNFNLRGEESDVDESFVKSFAEKYNVPFYTTKFDTKNFAAQKKISTQMAARELRYIWFEKIRSENKYNFIASAHHKNDVAETILLNLIKGTVIKGLHGIKPKNNYLIRPLLWAEKEEILHFAKEKNISYREDSSNKEDKYQRNLLRNKAIPLLKQINPDVVETMYQNAQARAQIEEWLESQTADLFEKLFIKDNNGNLRCYISDINSGKINEAVLYQMLSEFNFSFTQIKNLWHSLPETEQKNFHSPTHRINKDRDKITIIKINDGVGKAEKKTNGIIIAKNLTEAKFNGMKINIETTTYNAINDLKNPSVAYLDTAKLTFPLKIRRWQPGDYFYPFGMEGKKKLSDYLTDIKASALEKEEQLVLVSNEEIVWIMGRRIDRRFAVSENSGEILKINWVVGS